MTDGSLEYVADTLLLQRIEAMDWALSQSREGGGKVAFAQNIDLNSEKNVIENAVSSVIDTSSTGSIIKSVLKILETGVLFKISPLLGIASVLGQAFGISITDWVASALPPIRKKVKEEGSVSAQEVNEAVAQAAPGGAVAAAAMLQPLHDIEKNGELVKMLTYEPMHKEAQSWWQSGGKFFGGGKGTPWYYRAFGFLSNANKKKMLGGIIAWVLKTVLLGAAVLGLGSAAIGMVGLPSAMPGQKAKDEKAFEAQAPEAGPMAGGGPGSSSPRVRPPTRIPMLGNYFNPSTLEQVSQMSPEELARRQRASQTAQNPYGQQGGGATQVFNLAPNGTPRDVVMQYALQKSPHLSEYQSIISSLPSFNDAVAALAQNHRPGNRMLAAPPDAVTKMNLFVLKANQKARQEQQKAQQPPAA